MSKKFNLNELTLDEMWQLHEEISEVLSSKLTEEKRQLEKRLAQLRREKESRETSSSAEKTAKSARRKYPRVYPKYRNPDEPSETWSGRGKQPRWLTAAIKGGRVIEDFVIGKSKPAEAARGRAREPGGSRSNPAGE